MRMSLSIGGALLALAAFASTADARMGGGGGMSMSSSMSHGGGHGSMSSSMGSPRGFSPDRRTFSPSGLATRVKGSNWKHPIDSDIGGDDPPKVPKTPTRPGANGNSSGGAAYDAWYWTHHHSDGGPPLACRGRPGGC